MKISKNIEKFIKNQDWTFAKTYAKTWPHEYIVQERVDNSLFIEFSNHINTFGYQGYFYDTIYTYFNHNEYVYWNIENIINRCGMKDTYEEREKRGLLPINFKE